MRICILAAGAGGMYCGSCLRDNALAGALIRAGHTVHLIPLFSPLRTDVPNHTQGAPVFFGGINIYLQHAMRLFRKTPRMFDWLLDRKWLLNAATKHGGSAPPEHLVDLTLDILKGERGGVAKEANRLVEFIRDELKPDVVTLPNLMFIGIAPLLREKLNVPVICELTGEDMFLDALGDSGGPKVRAAIQGKIDSVSKFVATSSHYAARMAEYLAIGRERIPVVYPGLPQEFLEALPTRPRPERPPDFSLTVGYLARICPEKGLGFLVDAMIQLRQRKGFEELELRVAGYLGKRDLAFFRGLQEKIDQSPLRGGMTYVGEVNQMRKITLLNSVDVFSVPAVYPEAKGIYLLEAFATGLCAVQPNLGSFSELMQKTGGGILTAADDAASLADGLVELLQNPQRRHEHGHRAQQIVHQEFTDAKMAEQMLKVFEEARMTQSTSSITAARLIVRDVAKEYPTPAEPLVVLRDVSLDLSPGDSVAVVGPSGSGKSTLLNILGTLDRPTRGTVRLGDVDPFSLSEKKLADFRSRHVGFVFQEHHLLPQCTALENVLLPRIASEKKADDASVRRAKELLQSVGLENRLTHFPSELSGGERQRVAVARAMMNNPPLLLADEPTGNLDATNSAAIGKLLADAAAQIHAILIVVTHSSALAETFAKRYRMSEGRLQPI